MNNVVSIGVDLNLIDQDFAKDLEKLTNSIKDINIGADTSVAEKAIKDLGKTVGNIGVKPITIKADTSQFNKKLQETIKEISKSAPEISVGFDKQSFVALSDSLDSIKSQYISLQDYFNSNPITIKGSVKVDTSDVRKRLEATLNSTVNIKTSGGTSENILKDFESNLPKAIEKGFRSANTKGLGSLLLGGIGGIGKLIFSTVLGGIGLIGSGIVGLITIPFKSAFQGISTIATGSLLKLGEDLSSDVSSGLKTAINSALSGVVGDSSLFGEAIGTVLSTVIGDKLGGTVNSISKQVKSLMTEILGTEKVAVASAVQRSKQGVSKADKNTAAEQVQKEFQAASKAKLPARAKQLQSEVAADLPQLQEDQAEFNAVFNPYMAKVKAASKEISVKLTPEELIKLRVQAYEKDIKRFRAAQIQAEKSGDKGKASQIGSLISQLKAPDVDVTKITSNELRLAEVQQTANLQVAFENKAAQKFAKQRADLAKRQVAINAKIKEFQAIEKTLENVSKDLEIIGSPAPVAKNNIQAINVPAAEDYSDAALKRKVKAKKREAEIANILSLNEQQQQPYLYKNIVQGVAQNYIGQGVNPSQIPKLKVNTAEGTGGAYDVATNSIALAESLLVKLKENLPLLEEEVSTLVHEIIHALDMDFGNRTPDSPVRSLKPNQEEIKLIGERVEFSSRYGREGKEDQEKLRQTEINANVGQIRYTPSIFAATRKSQALVDFNNQFGAFGSLVGSQRTNIQNTTSAKIAELQSTAGKLGLDVDKFITELQVSVQDAEKKFITTILPLVPKYKDIESLDTNEIIAVQEQLTNAFSELETAIESKYTEVLNYVENFNKNVEETTSDAWETPEIALPDLPNISKKKPTFDVAPLPTNAQYVQQLQARASLIGSGFKQYTEQNFNPRLREFQETGDVQGINQQIQDFSTQAARAKKELEEIRQLLIEQGVIEKNNNNNAASNAKKQVTLATKAAQEALAGKEAQRIAKSAANPDAVMGATKSINLADETKKKLAELEKQGVKVGQDFSAGFVQGFEQSQGEVLQSVANEFNQVLETVDITLDRNSPSEEMRKRGLDFGEGFEIGAVASLVIANKRIADLILATINESDSATEAQKNNALSYAATVEAENARVAEHFREGKYNSSNASEAVQRLEVGTKYGEEAAGYIGIDKSEIAKILQQSNREANSVNIPDINPVELAQLNAELARQKKKQWLEQQRANLNIEQKERVKSQAELNAIAAAEQARFRRYAKSNRTPAQVVAERQALEARINAEVNTPDRQLTNLKNSQASRTTRTLVGMIKARKQEQQELNRQLAELENQDILDPSIGADVALESVTRERDRRQTTLKNIRQNPIKYVADRVQGATVQKARYLTENAESLANMVSTKVGANPGFEDVAKLTRLQNAFGDLGDKAARFGENKSKDNFKQMNAAVVELENSLRELGVPFELINQQIDTFISGTKRLQAEGKIDLDVDVESLAPEKFSFIDNILAKFSGLELGGLKALAGLAKGFIAFQAGMLLQNFFSTIAQESFKAYVELDKLRTVLDFSSGSNLSSNSNLKFITQQVKDLKIPLQATVQGFTQLLAASRGTSLVNRDVRDISKGIGQASTVLSLSAEETQGSVLALSQMLSKGRVQAEELRGQLGERIPGAMGIAARSMGITEAALNRLMQTGNLASDVFAPKFGRQLQAEFGDAAKYAAGNAQSAIFGVQNSYLQLQQSLGEDSATVTIPGLNILSATLQFLAENAKTLRNVFAALAVTLSLTIGKALLQVATYFISTNLAVTSATGGLKAFLTMLNTSGTVMWTVGIFAVLEVFDKLNGAINTELVQSFDKATEAAKRTKLAISDAFKPPARGSSFKPESTSGFGRFMDDIGLPLAEDVLKRSTLGIFKPKLATYGQLENDTNTIALREQLSVYADALQEAQGKLNDLKAGKGDFKNLAPLTKRLQIAEQERDILKAEIQKQYTSKGLQTPAANVLNLDAKTQEINKLSEQRQKAAQSFTTILAQSDLTIRALRSQIENLGSDDMLKSFSPQQLAEQESALKESLKYWLEYKTELEKTLGDMRLDPIIRLLNKVSELNRNLAEFLENDELNASLAKGTIAYNQNQEFSTNKYNDRQTAIQNAEQDSITARNKYYGLANTVKQDNELLASPEIARTLATFGITKDTSLAAIDRIIENTDDRGTKETLEKIKVIKERRKQLADAFIGVSQAEIAVKQAKQDYYLSRIDTDINELKAKNQLEESNRNNQLKKDFFNLNISQQARDLLTERSGIIKLERDLKLNIIARQAVDKLIKFRKISALEAQNRIIALDQDRSSLEGQLTDAKQKFRESSNQLQAEFPVKNAEINLSKIKVARFTGKLNVADFNKQSLTGNLELNDAKLAGLNIRRKAAIGSTALAVIKAEEANIAEERSRAQEQYATDELERLSREQEKAKNILELASLDRQKILQEQINNGIILQEDAQVEQLKLDRQKLQEDLKIEEERTSLLERTRYKDPIKDEQNQAAIRQSRIKTSQIILQLLQNEKSATEAQYTSLKAQIDRVTQSLENRFAVADQGYKRELNSFGLLERSLQRQNDLISAQKSLRGALSSYIDSYGAILKEGASDAEKQKIDKEIAATKLNFAYKQFEIEKQSTELAIRQLEIAQRKLEIENQRDIQKNKNEQAIAGLNYLAVQNRQGATFEEKKKARLAYENTKIDGSNLADIGKELEKNRKLNDELFTLKRKTTELEGYSNINNAELAYASAGDESGRQSRVRDLIDNKGYSLSNLRGVIRDTNNLASGEAPQETRINKLSNEQYLQLSNNASLNGVAALAEYSRINQENYGLIKNPPKPEVSQQSKDAQLINVGVEKLINLVESKINEPTKVTTTIPINNYYSGADGQKIGVDTVGKIRNELYDILRKTQER